LLAIAKRPVLLLAEAVTLQSDVLFTRWETHLRTMQMAIRTLMQTAASA
jgi:hypothetical protein